MILEWVEQNDTEDGHGATSKRQKSKTVLLFGLHSSMIQPRRDGIRFPLWLPLQQK